LISLALKPPTFYQNSKSISKQQTHSLASSQPNNASRLMDLLPVANKRRKEEKKTMANITDL
jgi:hypothetical protein